MLKLALRWQAGNPYLHEDAAAKAAIEAETKL